MIFMILIMISVFLYNMDLRLRNLIAMLTEDSTNRGKHFFTMMTLGSGSTPHFHWFRSVFIIKTRIRIFVSGTSRLQCVYALPGSEILHFKCNEFLNSLIKAVNVAVICTCGSNFSTNVDQDPNYFIEMVYLGLWHIEWTESLAKASS